MENLKSLKGAKVLNKAEQQLIKGGKMPDKKCGDVVCHPGYICHYGVCRLAIYP